MSNHVSVGTNELARAFYDPVLTLLGYRLLSEDEVSIDYGIAHIVFSVETPADGARATPGNGVHVAFEALDRAMVDRFHAIALANGGTDDGPQGVRPQYAETTKAPLSVIRTGTRSKPSPTPRADRPNSAPTAAVPPTRRQDPQRPSSSAGRERPLSFGAEPVFDGEAGHPAELPLVVGEERLRATAWAAINRSLAPISLPIRSVARICP